MTTEPARAFFPLVFLALALAGLAPDAVAAPRIQFESKTLDAGQVVWGDVAERVFRFRNVGDEDLIIHRLNPTCGCTAALLSSNRLAPREEGQIRVRFESRERPRGPQDIAIYVFANDPLERDQGEYISRLHFKADVVSFVNLVPAVVYFGEFTRSESPARTAVVMPQDRAEVAVLGVSASARFEVSVAPRAAGDKKGAEISLRFRREAPLGPFEETLEVRTDHPSQPTVPLRVLGIARGAIRSSPDRIVVTSTSPLAPETGAEVRVSLQRFVGSGLDIDTVDAPPQYRVEVHEILPGKHVEVALKLKPDAARGPFSGTVRISLREADQALIEIPIYGDIPRRVLVEPTGIWIVGPAPGAHPAPAGDGGIVATTERVLRVFAAPDVADGLTLRAAVSGAPLTARVVDGRTISINVQPEAKPGPFSGTLTIETNVPGEERIVVPVRGVLHPSSKP